MSAVRFPGGGPGLGKNDGGGSRAKPAKTPKSSAKAKTSKAKHAASGGSNSTRRIITDTYSAQVLISDFVVSCLLPTAKFFFLLGCCFFSVTF